MKPRILFLLIMALSTTALKTLAQTQSPSGISESHFKPPPYIPDSKELYDTIVHMDSLYFDTYNNCKLDKMSELMSDDLEFYHDKGGFDTSKNSVLEGIKKNICGKVRRELAKGSIEVYPIHNYGAVEIGYHHFYNNTSPADVTPKDSKFIVIWKKEAGNWKMSRVISLH